VSPGKPNRNPTAKRVTEDYLGWVIRKRRGKLVGILSS
jgi:hypothetical protein